MKTRIPFRLDDFKEKLTQDLSKQELQFCIRTFGNASYYFALFGLVTWTLFNALVFGFGIDKVLTPMSVITTLCLLLSLGLFFFTRWRYYANPLTSSRFVRVGSYVSTLSMYFSSFILALVAYVFLVEPDSIPISTAFILASCFGVAWLVFLIPVFIAWFVIKRKQVISLMKFVRFCMFFIFAFFLLSIALIFLPFSVGMVAMPVMGIFSFILFPLSVFLAIALPILALYRMKVTAMSIDYDNSEEVKAWETYFVLEILEQLLYLALKIFEIMLRVIARSKS